MDKVLIVDDSEIGRFVLGASFEDRFDCHFASDGAEAIELLGKNEYSVVFLDIMMPVVDGFGVLAFLKGRMKSDPSAKTPAVIVLSVSSADEDIRERCFASGAAACLGKPYRIREINAAVARARAA